MYRLYPDLAKEHIDWLLVEAEHRRLADQARAARRRRRERHPQRAVVAESVEHVRRYPSAEPSGLSHR